MNKIIALIFCLVLASCKEAPPPETAPGLLTAAEQQTLKNLGTLKVGGDAYYPPFVFVDAKTGKLTGLAIEYFDEVARRLDIKYEVTFIGQRTDILKQLEEKKIDVTLASRTSSSRPYLIVTPPYEYSKGTIVVKKGFDITKLKEVGAGRGYASVTWLKTNRPDVTVVEFEDDAQCLRNLLASKVQSCIMGREMVFYFTDTLGIPIGSLELTPTPYEYFLSFGVHVENPQLQQLLTKGMGMIPGSRRRELLEKWLKEPDT